MHQNTNENKTFQDLNHQCVAFVILCPNATAEEDTCNLQKECLHSPCVQFFHVF